MKKLLSILVTVMGMAAVFSFCAFAAEGGSDVGVNNAIAAILEARINLFAAQHKLIAEPILQVVVWLLDELWGWLQETISGLL